MREAGMDYFTGWNILDLAQLVNFTILRTIKSIDFEEGYWDAWLIPEQNLLLIFLAFVKLL